MNILEICLIEEISPDSKVYQIKNSEIRVIKAKKKLYVWFPNRETAKEYVVNYCSKRFDDLNEMIRLKSLNTSVKEFLKSIINHEGIESLFSFNSKHKIECTDNSVCFRII